MIFDLQWVDNETPDLFILKEVYSELVDFDHKYKFCVVQFGNLTNYWNYETMNLSLF